MRQLGCHFSLFVYLLPSFPFVFLRKVRAGQCCTHQKMRSPSAWGQMFIKYSFDFLFLFQSLPPPAQQLRVRPFFCYVQLYVVLNLVWDFSQFHSEGRGSRGKYFPYFRHFAFKLIAQIGISSFLYLLLVTEQYRRVTEVLCAEEM